MKTSYEKAVDGITLVETRTPDPVQAVSVVQNFDLDFLTSQIVELQKRRDDTVIANQKTLDGIDKEIADNQARIDKCTELNVIKKSDVIVEPVKPEPIQPVAIK